jgi:hypothetical protein
MSNCPYCLGDRTYKKYCTRCKPSVKPSAPDKIALVIRYPQTLEEETKMFASIQEYRLIEPIFVYSSPKPDAVKVAECIASKRNTTVIQHDSLAPTPRVNPRAIESLLPEAIGLGLYIFVTHEPHAKLTYREYYRLFTSVSRPPPITIERGEMIVVDLNSRRVFKK